MGDARAARIKTGNVRDRIVAPSGGATVQAGEVGMQRGFFPIPYRGRVLNGGGSTRELVRESGLAAGAAINGGNSRSGIGSARAGQSPERGRRRWNPVRIKCTYTLFRSSGSSSLSRPACGTRFRAARAGIKTDRIGEIRGSESGQPFWRLPAVLVATWNAMVVGQFGKQDLVSPAACGRSTGRKRPG
jgi:hypothetical protein